MCEPPVVRLCEFVKRNTVPGLAPMHIAHSEDICADGSRDTP